jgi:hypothetical protein
MDQYPPLIPRRFQKTSGAKSELELNNQLIATRDYILKPEEISKKYQIKNKHSN